MTPHQIETAFFRLSAARNRIHNINAGISNSNVQQSNNRTASSLLSSSSSFPSSSSLSSSSSFPSSSSLSSSSSFPSSSSLSSSSSSQLSSALPSGLNSPANDHYASGEVSRLFAPYPSNPSRGIPGHGSGVDEFRSMSTSPRFQPTALLGTMRSRGAAAANRTPTVNQSRHRRGRNSEGMPFNRKLMFLGDPNEFVAPDSDRQRLLFENRLGVSSLICPKSMSGAGVLVAVAERATRNDERFRNVNWDLAFIIGSGNNHLSLFLEPPCPVTMISMSVTTVYAIPTTVLVPFVNENTQHVPDSSPDASPHTRSPLLPLSTLQIPTVTAPSQIPQPGSTIQNPSYGLVDSVSPAIVHTDRHGGSSFPSTITMENTISQPGPSTVLGSAIQTSTSVVSAPGTSHGSTVNTTLHGGFSFNSTTRLANIYSGVFSIDSFKRRMWDQNPGITEISVVRTNGFPTDTLLDWYTEGKNLYQKLRVQFTNEGSVDAGGPTREFFWGLMTGLMESGYRGEKIFEGEMDFYLPATSVELTMDGTFVKLTRFMLHAALNTGHFFLGLSSVIRQYIFCNDLANFANTVEICERDLPCLQARDLLKDLQNYKANPDACNAADLGRIRCELIHFNIVSVISCESVDRIIRLLKYSAVVSPRICQLNTIRQTVRRSPLYQFLKIRPSLIEDMFAKVQEGFTTVEQIIEHFEELDSQHDGTIFEWLGTYLHNFAASGHPLQKFIIWLSNLPILTADQFQLRFYDMDYVDCNTCTRELLVPREITQHDFNSQLNFHLLEIPLGFSRA